MITFLLDEVTPCIKDSITGELFETEVLELKRKSFLSRFNSKNGWFINWGQFPKGVRVFALVIKGTTDYQGLVAVEPDDEAKTLHILWACTAPQNNIWKYGFQKYIGVGGHLFAIAADVSEMYGYDGYVYGEAMDEKVMNYYVEKFGAFRIPRPHPFSIAISGEQTKKIREVYDYVWSDEEIN